MKPQRITFGRMYPNAGYQAKFRREIRRLIKAMRIDTQRELKALSGELIQDAPITLTEIMARLRLRWYKIFEKRAREMSRWLVETVKKRTRKDIMNQLKKIGMALEPHYTDTQDKMFSVFVEETTSLIKTIPQKFLRTVQDEIREAAEKGDRAAIKELIENEFDSPLVKTTEQAERRAELIAQDQVQKVTQEYARENAKAYGATKAEWIHIPGEKSSRITHIEMDGKEFDIDVGLYDSDVGEYVKPAQLIYCRCTQAFIFPGTE